MFRNPNDNYMISPMRSPGDLENSLHSDVKKSKNRHLVIINQLRKKEDTWDGRFHLQNIPEYNFVDDKHTDTYKKMLVKKKSRKFVLKKELKGQPSLEAGGPRRRVIDDGVSEGNYRRPESHERGLDLRIRGIYPQDIRSKEKIRPESMRKYTPLTETYLKEKKAQEERLTSTWDRLNIPSFHRDTFLKCENPQNVKQTTEILKKEADSLDTNSSPIQLAIRAITAREHCLKHLRTLISKIEPYCQRDDSGYQISGIDQEDAKQRASELLTHLRILSLNAVETILKWREYIQQSYYITRGVVKANQTIIIPFLHNDVNYLIKMKNDTRDLIETPLNNYFNFSAKSDPFLVYPSKELDQHTDKIVLYVSKNLINRIRACELVILEESVHEHIAEKPSSITSQPQMKTSDSPSERSLHKDLEQSAQKKHQIKVKHISGTISGKSNKVATLARPVRNEPRQSSKLSETNAPSQNNATEEDQMKKDASAENTPLTISKKNTSSNDPIEESQPKLQAEKECVTEAKKEVAKEEIIKAQDVPTEESTPQKESQSVVSWVNPVDLYEDEVEQYCKLYLEGVDHGMKNSFISEPKDLLERANMGQDPIWFELVDPSSEKRVGLAVAHIDNTVFTSRRMVILHFTVNNRENYSELLKQFVEYLWKNDECNEIKMSLYYLEDQNSNLGADKQLQDALKGLGFRWKQLTNDKITMKRYIDYVIKRPEGVKTEVQRYSDEPIHIKSVVVLSDLNGEIAVNKAPKYIFDSRYAVLSAILKHTDQDVNKIPEQTTQKGQRDRELVASLAKEGQAKIGDLTGKFPNLKELVAFVGEKFEEKDELLPQIDEKYSTNIFTTSLLNLIYRWKSYNVTQHLVGGVSRKYLKLHNNEDLVLFKSEYKECPIYFIPTDDNEVNIFVTDDEGVINDILNKAQTIEDTVDKLLSKLDPTPAFKEDLWLPLFSMKDRNIDLEYAKSLLQNEDKVNYAVNTCTIGLNGSRIPGNLKVRISDKSRIVEKPFLIGVLHEQVDFPLFSAVIQPQDFLKADIVSDDEQGDTNL